MASSPENLLFTLFFLMTISSCCAQSSGGVGGGGGADLPCVPKLLPCQPILISHATTNPPPTCCNPLKQIVEDDPKCLCHVFSNPIFLKSLNITQDDALTLAKNCQANADFSICKTLVNPPSSSPAAKPSPTSTNSSASPPPKSGAAAAAAAIFGKTTTAISSAALILLISLV